MPSQPGLLEDHHATILPDPDGGYISGLVTTSTREEYRWDFDLQKRGNPVASLGAGRFADVDILPDMGLSINGGTH